MASTSVSSIILFIASIIIATSVAGTMYTTVSGFSNTLDERGDGMVNNMETEIDIISDPGSGGIYDSSTETVTLLVKNTGTNTLEPSQTDIVLDGQYTTASNTEVIGAQYWKSGEVVRITIDTQLNNGQHRVSIVHNSDREELEFFL